MLSWTATVDDDVADRARDLLAQHGMPDAAIVVVPGIVSSSLGPATRQGFGPAVYLALSMAAEQR